MSGLSDPRYLLLSALAVPFGIAVETPQPKALAEALRAWIRRTGEAKYLALEFRREPVHPYQALWIINRNAYENEQLQLLSESKSQHSAGSASAREGDC